MTPLLSYFDRHALAFGWLSLGTMLSAETLATVQQIDALLSVAVRGVSLAVGICSLVVLLRRLVWPVVLMLRRRRRRRH